MRYNAQQSQQHTFSMCGLTSGKKKWLRKKALGSSASLAWGAVRSGYSSTKLADELLNPKAVSEDFGSYARDRPCDMRLAVPVDT